MANPIHSLEDELQRLKQIEKNLKHDIKLYEKELKETQENISKFENSINLLKKGE